jgi:hypothetical protein
MQLFIRFKNQGLVFLFIWIMGIATTGLVACSHQKPGCGNKHQHKTRAKKVKRMAPGMSM